MQLCMGLHLEPADRSQTSQISDKDGHKQAHQAYVISRRYLAQSSHSFHWFVSSLEIEPATNGVHLLVCHSLQERMKSLESIRLELDSRRRTVNGLQSESD
jgi:hypothetical protein